MPVCVFSVAVLTASVADDKNKHHSFPLQKVNAVVSHIGRCNWHLAVLMMLTRKVIT